MIEAYLSARIDESQKVLLARFKLQLVLRARTYSLGVVEIQVHPLYEEVVRQLWPTSLFGMHYPICSRIEPVGERHRPEVDVVLCMWQCTR